jgi:hypothetical protein
VGASTDRNRRVMALGSTWHALRSCRWRRRSAAVAIEQAGRKYVSLAALVELKLASGLTAPDRPRDFDDVIQLIRSNRLGEHFADGLHAYVQPRYRELWGYAQRPTDLPG